MTKIYYKYFLRIMILAAIYIALAVMFRPTNLGGYFLLISIFILLALAMGIHTIRGLTINLRLLLDANQRILEGDYEINVQIPRRDEIGFLGIVTNEFAQFMKRQQAIQQVILDTAIGRMAVHERAVTIAHFEQVASEVLPLKAVSIFIPPPTSGSADPALPQDLTALDEASVISAQESSPLGILPLSKEKNVRWLESLGWTARMSGDDLLLAQAIPLTRPSGGILAVAIVQPLIDQVMFNRERFRDLRALLGALSLYLLLKDAQEEGHQHAMVLAERRLLELINAASSASPFPEVQGFHLARFALSGSPESSTDCMRWIDLRHQNGHLFLILGDALTGGWTAALVKAILWSCLESLQRSPTTWQPSPADILGFVNAALFSIGAGELLLSLLVVEIEPETDSIQYASAGHLGPFLLLKTKENRTKDLSYRCPLLGVASERHVEQRRHKLQPTDIILLSTDGLIEGVRISGAEADKSWALQLIKEGEKMKSRVLSLQIRAHLAKQLKRIVTDETSRQQEDVSFILIEKLVL